MMTTTMMIIIIIMVDDSDDEGHIASQLMNIQYNPNKFTAFRINVNCLAQNPVAFCSGCDMFVTYWPEESEYRKILNSINFYEKDFLVAGLRRILTYLCDFILFFK